MPELATLERIDIANRVEKYATYHHENIINTGNTAILRVQEYLNDERVKLSVRANFALEYLRILYGKSPINLSENRTLFINNGNKLGERIGKLAEAYLETGLLNNQSDIVNNESSNP